MSGFVGLLHTDGRRVEPAVLDRMSRAIAHRGRDRSGAWVSGPEDLAPKLHQRFANALELRASDDAEALAGHHLRDKPQLQHTPIAISINIFIKYIGFRRRSCSISV